MRVIDHKAFESKKKGGKKLKKFLFILVIATILALIYEVGIKHAFNGNDSKNPKNTSTTQEQTPASKDKLKQFTPEQFRDLYKSFAFPNTQKISETTPITGYEELDVRIRDLAHAKGYVIRSAPIVDSFIAVDPEHKLQQKAYVDWVEMRDSAQRDGVGLKVTAAYRSADDQRAIFLPRLGNLYNPSDAQINYVLTTTAPPGYSRHHTGYTIDLTCAGSEYVVFEKTPCFVWLSQNNYENTKKAGWIPSYPAGAQGQGPEPESWEYVWVSKDSTHQ